MNGVTRRKLIRGGIATVAGITGVGAIGRIAQRHGLIPPDCRGVYGPGETLNYGVQRLLTRHALAREFPRAMISKAPFANATDPPGEGFNKLRAAGFLDWRLQVDGMVAHPLSLTISDLKSMPMSRQITEVACEEGWSYIAEWIGTPLAQVLAEAGVLPQARYIVYFGMPADDWDSIDMAEAHHPQTQLTWAMNDGDLPVGFGGPLRMRLPRQLGYKNLKYITRLTATDSMKHFGKGLGSASPEYGYAWYAGI